MILIKFYYLTIQMNEKSICVQFTMFINYPLIYTPKKVVQKNGGRHCTATVRQGMQNCL